MTPGKPRKEKRNSRRRHWYRVVKFHFLQRVVLPIFFPLLWLYVRSWRVTLLPEREVAELFATGRRGAVAVLHGDMISLLGFAGRKHFGLRPPITVITSGSRDGQLQAALLRFFGQQTVVGSSGRGGASGLLKLRRTIREGRFGVVAVDGPRGPFAQAKPGVLALAENGRVPLFAFITRARPAIRLNFFWDRHTVPLPFARVEGLMMEVPFDPQRDATEQLAVLQRSIYAQMAQLGRDVTDVPAAEDDNPPC